MPAEKGRQQYLTRKIEATAYTAETTEFSNYLPIEEFSSMNEVKNLEDRSGYDNVGGLMNQYLVYSTAKANVGGKLDADNVLWALHTVLGTSTPTTANSCTTWVFAMSQSSQLPTQTFQFQRGDEGAKRIVGAVTNKVKLSWTLDDSKYSADIIAQKEEAGNAQTSSYSKQTRYLTLKNLTPYFATTLAGLGSFASPVGTQFKLRSLEIDIENGAIDMQESTSLNPTQILANGRKIMVTMEVLLSTANAVSTFQAAHDAGTKLAFRFRCVAADQANIGTSANKPTIDLALPESDIKVEPAMPLDDFMTQKISFEVEMPNLSVTTLVNSLPAV
jgi:hypothetical protein